MADHQHSNEKDPRIELVRQVLEEAANLLMAHLPQMQSITEELIDILFVPKIVAKQLTLMFALQAGLLTLQQVSNMMHWVYRNFSSRSRLIRQLQEEQKNSVQQDDWMDLAERIDNIQGNDVWRSDPNCQLYERERIAARIDEYVHLMRRRDIFELMFVLRGSISRNKFGLLHEGLFTQALAGSKVLSETYHNVVCAALDFVCDAPVQPGEEPIPTDARLAFFNETRHAYGRTALLLSGGAALGFYHVGVVKTLMENRLMPRVIGGSSAGSIVCSMIGTRTDEECMTDLMDVRGTHSPGHSGRLAFNFFRPVRKAEEVAHKRPSHAGGLMEVYSNTAGAFHDAKRTVIGFMPIPMRRCASFLYDLLTGNTRPQDLFKNDTEHFRECVRANVGNFTFQEAFDRTGRILNIVVTPKNATDPPRLLNYLTAPHVMVWSAAVASSSLPGVFEANRLVVKEADGLERYESGGEQAFSDGSMEQDLPMQQLSEMFNVNHFIVSQANPHAVMFASYNEKVNVWTNPLAGCVNMMLVYLKDQLRSWLANLASFVGSRRIAPTSQRGIGVQFFTQEYEGRPLDISLIPWLGHRGLISAMLHIIYNPSEAEFREWIQAAERETWRYIPAIKSHIAEEVTLDNCVQRLRKRLVQESWEKEFRSNETADEVSGMSGRVPSFYTSSSIVNLSGLGVSDQPTTDNIHEYSKQAPGIPPPTSTVPDGSHNSGWGGQGLRGNRSNGNLQRTASDASGLFIDDEEHSSRQQQQDAGESTMIEKRHSAGSLRGISDSKSKGYVKTTSMARFYYRKTALPPDAQTIQKTTSDSFIDRDLSRSSPDELLLSSDGEQRRKSHADLEASTKDFIPIKD